MMDIQVLQSLDLFADLEPEELETIAPLVHPMRVTEGEMLTRRGDLAQTFYIVLSGNFMVYFKEGQAFTLHDKGDTLGWWSAVITPHQYSGTTVALTDGEVLTLASDEFLRLLQSDSSLGDKIMRKINAIIAQRMSVIKGLEES